jgi:hypothetical protein
MDARLKSLIKKKYHQLGVSALILMDLSAIQHLKLIAD